MPSKNHKIIIANGVNLDLLGQREPEIYGKNGLDSLEKILSEANSGLQKKFGQKVNLEFFQSNDEGEFLKCISQKCSVLIINAGAWTHTSLAIADRLKAVKTPYFEVHVSNTFAREEFRHRSYLAPHAQGVLIGMGLESYVCALLAAYRIVLCN